MAGAHRRPWTDRLRYWLLGVPAPTPTARHRSS